ITGSPTLNAMGYCIGGTLLTMTLATLAAKGDKRFNSASFMVSLQDFSRVGDTAVFMDEPGVDLIEQQMMERGYLDSREMSNMFNLLRSNDLIWANVVNNYLMGNKPPAFDLLYWNSDSTNLPGPFYAWYLRNLYLENNLVKPGRLTVCGEPIDMNLVDLPVYIYGSREDHIVPAAAAYASTQALPGDRRFVMGASGHIAGVINPPAKKKRSHWLREDGVFPETLADWLAGATEHPGS
ncbi:alpha/beta fold hydrolase, partial [Corallococcus exiguus]|nr:alpha/beta fold hydrolase [Corallococcus exiguus]